MKRSRVGISEELFLKKLGIPENYRISEVEWDGKYCCVNIYLYGGEETPEVAIPKMISFNFIKNVRWE